MRSRLPRLVTGVVPLTMLSLTAPSLADQRAAGPDEVVRVLSRVKETVRESKYAHATRVDEKNGRYEFDCSGMVAWVLRKAAPKAHAAVTTTAKTGRPLARDYYQHIARTKPGSSKWGWARVERVADARPGDIIAWLKPKEIDSANTGHVAFVVGEPVRVPELGEAYLLRIADASRYQHQDDTRAETGWTGFGIGTILVVGDPESGAPVAYGWFGARSSWILSTPIAIGRVTR